MTDTSNSSSASASGDDQPTSDQTFLETMRIATPTERIVWLEEALRLAYASSVLEPKKVYWERGVGSDELIASLIVWTIAEGRKMAAGIDKPCNPASLPRSQSLKFPFD